VTALKCRWNVGVLMPLSLDKASTSMGFAQSVWMRRNARAICAKCRVALSDARTTSPCPPVDTRKNISRTTSVATTFASSGVDKMPVGAVGSLLSRASTATIKSAVTVGSSRIDTASSGSRRGVRFSGERQRHRQYETMIRTVEKHVIAKEPALAALAHDDDARLVQHGRAAERSVCAHAADAGEHRCRIPLGRGQLLHQPDAVFLGQHERRSFVSLIGIGKGARPPAIARSTSRCNSCDRHPLPQACRRLRCVNWSQGLTAMPILAATALSLLSKVHNRHRSMVTAASRWTST
jgi:hypothetical protein